MTAKLSIRACLQLRRWQQRGWWEKESGESPGCSSITETRVDDGRIAVKGEKEVSSSRTEGDRITFPSMTRGSLPSKARWSISSSSTNCPSTCTREREYRTSTLRDRLPFILGWFIQRVLMNGALFDPLYPSHCQRRSITHRRRRLTDALRISFSARENTLIRCCCCCCCKRICADEAKKEIETIGCEGRRMVWLGDEQLINMPFITLGDPAVSGANYCLEQKPTFN